MDELMFTILNLVRDNDLRRSVSEAALNFSVSLLDSFAPLRDALTPFIPERGEVCEA
jgi:hypothetical protein